MSDLMCFVSHLRCLSRASCRASSLSPSRAKQTLPLSSTTALCGTLWRFLAPRCIPQSLTILIFCAGTSSRAFAAQGYATPLLTADRARSPGTDVDQVPAQMCAKSRCCCYSWAMQMTGGRSRRSRKRRRGTCTNARRSVGPGQASDGLQTANNRTNQAKRMGLRCTLHAVLHRVAVAVATCHSPAHASMLHGTRYVGMLRRHGIWRRHVGCCNPSA